MISVRNKQIALFYGISSRGARGPWYFHGSICRVTSSDYFNVKSFVISISFIPFHSSLMKLTFSFRSKNWGEEMKIIVNCLAFWKIFFNLCYWWINKVNVNIKWSLRGRLRARWMIQQLRLEMLPYRFFKLFLYVSFKEMFALSVWVHTCNFYT